MSRILKLILISSFFLALSACQMMPPMLQKSPLTKEMPLQYRNVMLEALTQRDWLSTNEFGLSTLHSFRINDHGLIVKYIQFSEQNLPVVEAQQILNITEYGTDQTREASNPVLDSTLQQPQATQTHKKSTEFYINEVPDGYQLDLTESSFVKFALSPDNRLVRIIRLSWKESHLYPMFPLDKLQKYDDGVF